LVEPGADDGTRTRNLLFTKSATAVCGCLQPSVLYLVGHLACPWMFAEIRRRLSGIRGLVRGLNLSDHAGEPPGTRTGNRLTSVTNSGLSDHGTSWGHDGRAC